MQRSQAVKRHKKMTAGFDCHFDKKYQFVINGIFLVAPSWLPIWKNYKKRLSGKVLESLVNHGGADERNRTSTPCGTGS